MQWFKAHADFVDHPKTLHLNSLLSDDHSLYYLVRLWAWVCKFAENGDLTKFTPDQIEQACNWRGEKSKLLSNFIEAGFIDKTEEKMRVHDWFKENTRHLNDIKAKRRRRGGVTTVSPKVRTGAEQGALQDTQDRQDKTHIQDIPPASPQGPPGWNPFTVVMSVFKSAGVILTQRDPKLIAILRARAGGQDEILFTKAVRAYTEDSWHRQNGLSLNGLVNSLDKFLNQASVKANKDSEKRPIRLLTTSGQPTRRPQGS